MAELFEKAARDLERGERTRTTGAGVPERSN